MMHNAINFLLLICIMQRDLLNLFDKKDVDWYHCPLPVKTTCNVLTTIENSSFAQARGDDILSE